MMYSWVAVHSVIGCSVKIIVNHIVSWIIVPGMGVCTFLFISVINIALPKKYFAVMELFAFDSTNKVS